MEIQATNKIKKYKIGKKNKHLTLIMQVTHYCDKNCVYCFASHARKTYGEQVMTHKTLYDVLLKVSKSRESLSIVWHGGEPTSVGIEWFEKAMYIIDMFRNELAIDQSIQTNGSFLNDTWYKFFHSNNIHHGISFDYYTQNLRDTPEQRAEYTTERNLRRDIKVNGSSAITVLTSENQDKMCEYYKEITQKRGIPLSFSPVYDSLYSDLSHLYMDVPKFRVEYKKFIRMCLSISGPTERLVSSTMLMLADSNTVLCHHGDCRGAWLGINPDGKVNPCDTNIIGLDLGNIRKYKTIDEVYTSQEYLKYVNYVNDAYNLGCKKCDYFKYCHGNCHAVMVNNYIQNKFKPGDQYLCDWRQVVVDETYEYMRGNQIREAVNDIYLATIYKKQGILVEECIEVLKYSGLYNELDHTEGQGIKSVEFRKIRLLLKYLKRVCTNELDIDKFMENNHYRSYTETIEPYVIYRMDVLTKAIKYDEFKLVKQRIKVIHNEEKNEQNNAATKEDAK